MAKVTVEHVVQVLASSDVDTIAAFDLATDEKQDFVSGSKAELIAAVEGWEGSIAQPYRVRAWSSKTDSKRGQKTAADKPFIWTLGGTSGRSQPAPSAPPYMPPAAPLNGPDFTYMERAVRSEAELVWMRAEMQRLADAVDALNAELDEHAAEPIQAIPPPLSWWQDPQGIKAASEAFMPVVDRVMFGKRSGNGNSAAAPLPQGVPPSPDELELVAAVRAWRTADPAQAEMLLGQLRSEFGPQQTVNADPDGSAEN